MNSKLFLGMVLLATGLLVGWYIVDTGDSPDLMLKNTFQKQKQVVTPSKKITPTTFAPETEVSLEKGGQAARRVVTYTDIGFSPSPLTIGKGETVVFVNESSKQMQVASATYPMHQILPSFVQQSSVGKGGIYEYTFTSVGTWKYQNDSASSDSGSIIVQ